MNHTRALAAQWTGAPIRAIVPLPRRTRVLNGNNNAPATSASAHAHTRTTVRGRPRRRMRLVHLDRMDSRADNEGRGEEDEDDQESDEDEDRGVASASRYRSYESITAAEGLAAWSFEVGCFSLLSSFAFYLSFRGLTASVSGTACRMLCPVPRRPGHQTTSRGSTLARYSACVRLSYRPTKFVNIRVGNIIHELITCTLCKMTCLYAAVSFLNTNTCPSMYALPRVGSKNAVVPGCPSWKKKGMAG